MSVSCLRPLLPVLLLASFTPAPGATQTTAPFSCADTVRAALGAWLGDWEVRALFRTGPGTWDSTVARASFTPELGGCVLREDYQGTRYGEPYRYLALWGANGFAGARIERFFVHSLHGILGLAHGSFVGDSLWLEERFVVGGRPLLEQDRYVRPRDGRFTQLSRRSVDGGASWTVTLQASFQRAASGPP